MLKKIKIISIYVSLGNYKNFINTIINLAQKRISSYTCVANVHMTIEAYNKPFYANIINEADIVTPDGMPLILYLKWIYKIKQARVAGMDLFPDLLKKAEEKDLKVFLYGSTPEILRKLKEKVEIEFPDLKIAGFHSPPFRRLTSREEKEVIKIINKSNANIIFVSLGCPKQEIWMNKMKNKIKGLMIGVGAAFPVYAGVTKRAPRWMQKLSLEWFYRLLQEPRRLFKRYFFTNITFILLFFKDLMNSFSKIKYEE